MSIFSNGKQDIPTFNVIMKPHGKVEVDLLIESDSELRSLISNTEKIVAVWEESWSAMQRRIDETIEECDLKQNWNSSNIITSVYHSDPDAWMGDKSDTIMEIVIDDSSPEWNGFFKDGHLVHFQRMQVQGASVCRQWKSSQSSPNI